LAVLDVLRDQAVLAESSYRVLKDGYLFLRKVENRLRLMAGYPQSQLPREPQALHKLARLMGYLGQNAAQSFMQDYRQCTEDIRALYARVMRGL
jgi:glutamate-ammonia-ligase adenylyltransferase